MIHSLQSFQKKIVYNLDVIASSFGFSIGILILLLSFFGKFNQYSIGFTILFISVLYLFLKSRLSHGTIQDIYVSANQIKCLNVIFFILISITSIIWYNQLYSRPIEYFILVSLIAGLISLDILVYKIENRVFPILFKIFFLTLMVRAGIYYNFPSIMGYDAYIHTNIANFISITGFVPPVEISDKYINYPILHIFISITKTISCIDIKNAVFLSIGLISIVSILFFTYIIANRLAGPRIALGSALIIGLSNQIITTGITNITAGSLVLCYFMILLYLCLLPQKKTHIIIGLLFFVTAIIIITHQLSTFVVLLSVGLLAIFILLFAFSFEIEIDNSFFLFYLPFFAISMLIYWMSTIAYNDLSFFETVLSPFIDVLKHGGQYGSDLLIVGHEYSRPFSETILLQVSYLIIPFFSIGGIYYWLSKKDTIKFSIAMASAILFVIIYAVPLSGVRNLLTDRWMPFLLIFLGILASVFIFSCIDLIKSNFYKYVSIFLIISIFSFIMIITPGINKDNPLIAKDTTPRNQFTTNEISAVVDIKSMIGEKMPMGKKIFVDPSFTSAVLFYGGDSTIEYQKQMYEVIIPFSQEKEISYLLNNHGSIFILRKSTLNEPVILPASGLYGDTYAAHFPKIYFDSLERSRTHNQVFSNGNVLAYYSN